MSNPLDVLYDELVAWNTPTTNAIADVIRAVDNWDQYSGDVGGESKVKDLSAALDALKAALVKEPKNGNTNT